MNYTRFIWEKAINWKKFFWGP